MPKDLDLLIDLLWDREQYTPENRKKAIEVIERISADLAELEGRNAQTCQTH
jgi:hypothetical protein